MPIEHTFECTFSLLRGSARPYLELDHAFGVSLGWMVPGWGRAPAAAAGAAGAGADARARPPRLPAAGAGGLRLHGLASALRAAIASAAPRAVAAGGAELCVRPTDVVYPSRARAEAEYWARADFGGNFFALPQRAGDRRVNEAYTGDPERSWLDDLMARGPFRRAAVLGCDEGGYERQWIEAGASERLDVYELSPGVIRKVRAGLGRGRLEARRRVRFVRTDLNFARLPENTYDVVWSSGCLHHITNLEHLFAEVERRCVRAACSRCATTSASGACSSPRSAWRELAGHEQLRYPTLGGVGHPALGPVVAA